MFYYRITVTRTTDRDGEQTTRRSTTYREYLQANALGEDLAATLTRNPRPRAVTVQPVNQATYIRKTRGAE